MPNDREDPRDCNPMFKRLPAEVVARRGDRGGKKGQTTEKAPAATVELEQVLQKRADGRSKWLAKALIQASDGRMDAQSLYSVVAHNRFIEDLTEKTGNKMYRALHANLHVFSSKQRRFLEKDCALAKKYAKTAFAGVQKDAPDEDSKQEQAANAIEDMMARCRAFVREKQSERGERGEQGENGDDGAQEEAAAAEPSGEVEAPAEEEAKAPAATPAPAVTTGLASRSRSAPKAKEKQATKAKSKKKRESSSPSRRHSSSSGSRKRRKKRSRKDSRSSSSSGRHEAKKSGKRKSKDSESSDRSKKRKKKKHH